MEYPFVQELISLRLLLFIAFALLFLTIFWQAPEKLEGEVYDSETNDVMPDARVLLSDFRGMILDSAITDANGHFAFAVKQRQMYTLYILKPGYAPRTISDSEKINMPARTVVLRINVDRISPDY